MRRIALAAAVALLAIAADCRDYSAEEDAYLATQEALWQRRCLTTPTPEAVATPTPCAEVGKP